MSEKGFVAIPETIRIKRSITVKFPDGTGGTFKVELDVLSASEFEVGPTTGTLRTSPPRRSTPDLPGFACP